MLGRLMAAFMAVTLLIGGHGYTMERRTFRKETSVKEKTPGQKKEYNKRTPQKAESCEAEVTGRNQETVSPCF